MYSLLFTHPDTGKPSVSFSDLLAFLRTSIFPVTVVAVITVHVWSVFMCEYRCACTYEGRSWCWMSSHITFCSMVSLCTQSSSIQLDRLVNGLQESTCLLSPPKSLMSFWFFPSSEFQKSLQSTGQGPHIKGTFMQFASFNKFFFLLVYFSNTNNYWLTMMLNSLHGWSIGFFGIFWFIWKVQWLDNFSPILVNT